MPDPARTPVIVDAVRTPIGRFLGSLGALSGPELGAVAVREAISRSGVDPAEIDEVVMGNVVSAGAGQAPARQAALGGGVPASVPAVTVNKVCGSGLKAVMLAAQAVRAGDARLVLAGGFESMSNVPYYVRGLRGGVKFGDRKVEDGLIHDGLWCSFGMCHMGGHAEYTAAKAGVTREEADEFALGSHRKAVRAIDEGDFEPEIAPVEIQSGRGPTTVATDECPRRDTSLEALGRLRPAFPRDAPAGLEELVVTAGNAPGLNDGAAAVVVASREYAAAHGLSHRAAIGAYAAAGGRAEGPLLRSGARGQGAFAPGGRRGGRLRARGDQRGLRRAGGRRHPRARNRPRRGERAGRSRRPGAPYRGVRGAHTRYLAGGDGGEPDRNGAGDSLPRGRQRRGALGAYELTARSSS